MILDHVAGAVRDGKCILFLGAGVHAPPPQGAEARYPHEQRPPFGGDLSRLLAAECDLATRHPDEDPANLQRVALFYEHARSRRQLVEAIQQAVEVGRQPSPMLRALAELGFPLVISTNYDRHFESALAAAGTRPRVVIYTHDRQPTIDYRDPTPQSPIVFKIHGDVTRPETLVVTDEDYIQFVLRMSGIEQYDPIPITVKYHLTGWTTLFIGYSLLDYNLRLLFKTLRWKIDSANVPDMYAVDVKPDPLILDIWENHRRYVKFIVKDVWSFTPALYERVTDRALKP